MKVPDVWITLASPSSSGGVNTNAVIAVSILLLLILSWSMLPRSGVALLPVD